jgi:hypothetical protein
MACTDDDNQFGEITYCKERNGNIISPEQGGHSRHKYWENLNIWIYVINRVQYRITE